MQRVLVGVLAFVVAAATAPTVGPSGVLIGLRDEANGYRTIWVVNDGSGTRVVARMTGLVVPQARGFLVVDVVHASWQKPESDSGHAADFIVSRPLGSPPRTYAEVTSFPERAAAEDPDGRCDARDELSISFVGASHLSYLWNGYSDCGAHPDGSRSSGVVLVSTLPGIYAPINNPSADAERVRRVSLGEAIGPAGMRSVAAAIPAAMKENAETTCVYAPKASASEWHIVRGAGRWRLAAQLESAAGQYCYEGDIWPRLPVPRSITGPDALPFPIAALAKAVPRVKATSGKSEPDLADVFCSPAGANCLLLNSTGLVIVDHANGRVSLGPSVMGLDALRGTRQEASAAGPLTVVMLQWCTGSHVGAWTSALEAYAAR